MEGSLEHSSGPEVCKECGNCLNNHKVINISRKSLCYGLSWLVGWLVS